MTDPTPSPAPTPLAALLASVMRKSDDIAWPLSWYSNPDNFDWAARQLAARLTAAGVVYPSATPAPLDVERLARALEAAGVSSDLFNAESDAAAIIAALATLSDAPAPLREKAQAVVDAWDDLTSDTATANSLGLMAAAIAALRAALAALATPDPGPGAAFLLSVLDRDAHDPDRDAMWRYGVRHALTLVRRFLDAPDPKR